MKAIPTPFQLHPRLNELQAKRNDLFLEKSCKVAEAATVRARLQHAPSLGNVAENRVKAILGEPIIDVAAPDMERLDKLLTELNDLNGAINILDAAIQKERDHASRLICEAVRPEVEKLGKAFADAFVQLHRAHSDYLIFLDAIEATGASISSLGRVWPAALGHPRDHSSGYGYASRELREAGYLSKANVPEALR